MVLRFCIGEYLRFQCRKYEEKGPYNKVILIRRFVAVLFLTVLILVGIHSSLQKRRCQTQPTCKWKIQWIIASFL